MTRYKVLTLAALFLVFAGAASGIQVNVDALQFDGVNASFNESHVTFTNEYMEQSLDPQDVFVPSELHGNLDDFTYSLQEFNEDEWADVGAQLFLQVLYTTYTNEPYPNNDLDAVLGGDTSHSTYPGNQFGFSDSTTAHHIPEKEDVFNTSLVDGNVSFNITVSSDYEHLLIEYDVLYNDSVVWTTEDVFSGERPAKPVVQVDAQEVGDNTIAQAATYDNRFRDRKTVNVTFLYNDLSTLQDVNFNGATHEQVGIPYTVTKQELEQAGVNREMIVEDTGDWQVATYKVEIPADTEHTIEATYTYDDFNIDGLGINPDHRFVTYITGSGAAFEVSTDSDWNEGTFSNTRVVSGGLELTQSSSSVTSDSSGTDDGYSSHGVVITVNQDVETLSFTVYGDSIGTTELYSNWDSSGGDLSDFSSSPVKTTSGTSFSDVSSGTYLLAVETGCCTHSTGNRDYRNTQSSSTYIDVETGWDDTYGDRENEANWGTDSALQPVWTYGDISATQVDSPGSYTSKTFSSSTEQVWQNVTVGGLNRPSGSTVDLTVETSHDNFATVNQSQTISNSELSDGTNTYDLNELTFPTNDIRFKYDMTKGSSPSVDSTTVEGNDSLFVANWSRDVIRYDQEYQFKNFEVNVSKIPDNTGINLTMKTLDENNDSIKEETTRLTQTGTYNVSFTTNFDKFENITWEYDIWTKDHSTSPEIYDNTLYVSSSREFERSVQEGTNTGDSTDRDTDVIREAQDGDSFLDRMDRTITVIRDASAAALSRNAVQRITEVIREVTETGVARSTVERVTDVVRDTTAAGVFGDTADRTATWIRESQDGAVFRDTVDRTTTVIRSVSDQPTTRDAAARTVDVFRDTTAVGVFRDTAVRTIDVTRTVQDQGIVNMVSDRTTTWFRDVDDQVKVKDGELPFPTDNLTGYWTFDQTDTVVGDVRYEDFEDGDTDEWDTVKSQGSFSAQTGTVLNGSYTGKLTVSGTSTSIRDHRVRGPVRLTEDRLKLWMQYDWDSGNTATQTSIRLMNSTNQSIGTFRIEGECCTSNAYVEWNGKLIKSYSDKSELNGQNFTVDFDLNMDANEVTIRFDGTVNTFDFATNMDEINRVDLSVQANALDRSTLYVDNLDFEKDKTAEDVFDGNDGELLWTRNATGWLEQARQFDGSDDYVNVPDSDSLSLAEQYTMLAWVKRDNDNNAHSIMSHQRDFSNGGLYMTTRDGSATNRENNLYVQYTDDTFSKIKAEGGDVPPNQWTCVAARWNGTHISAFVNGTEVDATKNTNSPYLGFEAPLTIGIQYDDSDGSFRQPMHGVIDEPALYNRSLAQWEITDYCGRHTNNRIAARSFFPVREVTMPGLFRDTAGRIIDVTRRIQQPGVMGDATNEYRRLTETVTERATTEDGVGVVYKALRTVTQPTVTRDAVRRITDRTRTVTQNGIMDGVVDRTTTVIREATDSTGVTATTDRTVSWIRNVLDSLFMDTSITDNKSPRIQNVTVQVHDIGGDVNVSLRVNLTDYDNTNDLDHITFDGETRSISSGDGERVIDINDELNRNGNLTVFDTAGMNDTRELYFNVTDTDYETMDSDVNISLQRIMKNDTANNTGSIESFYLNWTHHSFGETVTTGGSNVTKLDTGTGTTLDTGLRGDFLPTTKQWHTDPEAYNTVYNQTIVQTLNVTNRVTDITWTDVNTTKTSSPAEYGSCRDCGWKLITVDGQTFSNTRLWTDHGDAINDEFVQDLADVVIGERKEWWEQHQYNNITEKVRFNDVWANTTIDDNETDWGGFVRVLYNNSFNHNEFTPKEYADCNTEQPPEEATATIGSQDWGACMTDTDGNSRPDFFRLRIPSFSEYEVRYGGHKGDSPADGPQIIIGDPCPDSEEGDLFKNDTVTCYKNRYREVSDTELAKRRIEQILGSAFGGLIAFIALAVAATIILKRREIKEEYERLESRFDNTYK